MRHALRHQKAPFPIKHAFLVDFFTSWDHRGAKLGLATWWPFHSFTVPVSIYAENDTVDRITHTSSLLPLLRINMRSVSLSRAYVFLSAIPLLLLVTPLSHALWKKESNIKEAVFLSPSLN
ncbi:hypothetical protein K1719_002431 [Acacia pycnantha]|nr:hypothetical protein K1719_002431 [Acacia pycnantha]